MRVDGKRQLSRGDQAREDQARKDRPVPRGPCITDEPSSPHWIERPPDRLAGDES
jgi:hypothetical protein